MCPSRSVEPDGSLVGGWVKRTWRQEVLSRRSPPYRPREDGNPQDTKKNHLCSIFGLLSSVAGLCCANRVGDARGGCRAGRLAAAGFGVDITHDRDSAGAPGYPHGHVPQVPPRASSCSRRSGAIPSPPPPLRPLLNYTPRLPHHLHHSSSFSTIPLASLTTSLPVSRC